MTAYPVGGFFVVSERTLREREMPKIGYQVLLTVTLTAVRAERLSTERESDHKSSGIRSAIEQR